ncbi:MAG TPA: glycosyltransferase family 9 protein [Gemmatimonadaceae bacterium]|nr:glycosyltransferase family 9 protein [Gemmatimonadaceae bacterium]
MTANTEQRNIRQRILVVSLDSVGDLVFATSLIEPLRRQFPGAHLGLWCKDYTVGLSALISHVDEFFSADTFWDKSPGRPKGRLNEFVRVLRRIRQAGFDTAILAHAPSRTAAAVAATAIPVRIGLRRGSNAKWLTHPLPAAERTKPVLEEMSRLLAGFGISYPQPRYRLDTSRLTSEKASIREQLGPAPRVALHAFAGAASRCVALDIWIEVADELDKRGYAPLWIGTNAELEKLREAVQQGSAAPSRKRWLYADKLFGNSLLNIALAISEVALFIGHDSGPLHIASALGVPSLGLYAPGEPARTFPQGVGDWRMIARGSPVEFSAALILDEAMELMD